MRRFSGLVFLCFISFLPAVTFAARPIAETYSNVTQGAFSRAANSVMRCDRTRESAGQCNAIESTSGSLQYNNNNTYTRWIDVDGVVDFDGNGTDDTFNSSAAQLSVPNDATVVWAGLYWHGNTRNTGQRTGVAPSSAATNRVRFRTSPAGTYSQVTANWCSTLGDRFACYADVLNLLDTANADGTYGVANIFANTGQDDYVGGWELMVVYEADTLPLRNLTIFHGHQTYGGGNALTFVANDFLTPLMGPIDAEVGFTIAEGDHGTTDAFSFRSQSAASATQITNDLGNGSIESFGVNVATRSPAYRNTLGHDSDTFDVGQYVQNGDTSATIGLPGSSGEQNDLIKVDFATDVYFPLVTSQKTVTDLNGGDVVVGDTLRYTITVSNDAAALDDAVNVSLTDMIDPNLDFLPGSINLATTVTGGPATGSKTAASGDDIATWDSTLRTLTVNLGAGATSAGGGLVAVGESTSITFDAIVLPGSANQRVTNSALITFEGATLAGRNRVRIATATSDDPTTQPRDTTDVTPAGDPDGDGLGASDADKDNDGILDVDEGFGVDVSGDSDSDGVLDYEDPDQPGFVDVDGNGVDDRYDFDGDGIPNHLDLDSDGDGVFDLWEARGRGLDANSDGVIDVIVDVDQDGVADAVDPSQGGAALTLTDTDNDGAFDPYDDDDDGDGILTATEVADAAVHGTDLDGDSIDPWYDTDSDGDGIDDEDETQDIDVDGVPDYLDAIQDFVTSPGDGATSTDGDVVVTGATEPGATVVISFDDGSGAAATQTVTADGAGAFTATFTGLADGSYTLTAEATDSTGASFTDSRSVTVQLLFVEIDQPADQTRTSDATPALVGRATPGATVTITVDAGTANEVAFTTTANAAGDWFVFSPALADGSHTIEASVDNGAGQTDSDTVTITVDTAPPLLTLDAPTDDEQTSDTTPQISGTSDPGQVVTVSIDGTVVGTVTADSNGDWSFTPTSPLADGAHLIEVSTVDDVGNQETESVTIVVDTIAPTIVVTSPADGAVVGSAQPTFAGQAEPGATVEVTIDGSVAGTTTADASGDWTFVPATPLAEGAHTASATATDGAGNTSSPSSIGFTVDTTVPYVVILSPVDQASTNQGQPEISGEADPNSDVEISIDGTVVATVMTDAMGNWTYVPAAPLSEGSHVVEATVDDGANVSSDTVTFDVDVTPPTLTVTSPTMGASVPATPTVVGTAEPGATVVVTLPDGSTVTTTADSNGDWSVIVGPLAEGMATLTATASDAAGNSIAETVDVVVDATAPAVKIDNPDDNSTKNDPLEPFEGTTDEPGAEVVLILDGAELARVTADANGAWTYSPTVPLADGVHTLEARVTDAAGNLGSDQVDFIIDTRAPDVEITSPAENEVSTAPRPAIAGTAPANSVVEVFVDGVKVGDATADANGDWTFSLTSDLADGEHRVVASTTDSAGNVGDDEVVFFVDTVAPFVRIDAPTDGSTTSQTDVTVSGETKPGRVVEVFVDGTKAGEVTADSNGDWSFVVTGLAEGSYTVQADAEGESDTTTFEVDLSAPDVAITSPTDGTLTNDDTPTVTGTAEPGATVEVFVDGVKVGETTADANGDWSFEIGPLGEGEHDIEALATDEAGNQGSSGLIGVTVDTTPPDLTVDNPVDGDSVEDGTTIGGTAEPGATVEVFVDGMKVGETTAGADGSWEYDLDDPGEGEHDIVVVATDPAGNTTEVGPITVFGGSNVGNNGTGNNGTGNNGTGNNGNGGGGAPDDDAYADSYLEGGCAQGRGGSLPGAWLLLLVGLLVVRRGRRE